MLDFLWTIFFFIITLSILITFHELGHFIFARYFNVKVLTFSIGFGKKIFSKRDKRGTEFVISVIPLGGYVKMAESSIDADSLTEEEKKQTLDVQPWYARFLIVFAGPFFNFILALIAFFIVFFQGISSLKPIINEVKPYSIAAQAGMQPNEEIINIAGNPTARWEDVFGQLIKNAGETNVPIKTQVFNTSAQKSYLLNLTNWNAGNHKKGFLEDLGIIPFQPPVPSIIGKVLSDSPAKAAGLLAGDRLIAINNYPLTSWQDLFKYYKTLPKGTESAVFTISRNQQLFTKKIQLIWPDDKADTLPHIGVISEDYKIPQQFLNKTHDGFFQSIELAFQKTLQMIFLTFILIGKMLMGKVALSSLSGPIGIAQGAGITAMRGTSYFFDFIATLSVSLGVINLLPIPMLDGGHLMFLLIESIRGKPISMEVQWRAMQVGLVLILCLMVIGMSNDLTRLFFS